VTDADLNNTADVVASAGLRRRRVFNWAALVLFIAAVGAGVAAFFLKSALDTANARATTAEAALAKAQQSLTSVSGERDELKAKAERLERENNELLALKTKLTSDVAAEQAAKDELEKKMTAEIKSGDISVSDDAGRIRVDLVDKVLFDSGEATISKHGIEVLTRLGAVLAGVQGKIIQVSGHTDDSPPSGKVVEKFPTNWELSTARASNVVRFLQETTGIPGKRLAATGYGQFRPIATNANPGGRAKNRRIEILLVPELEAVRNNAVAKAH
jgi:chemotaxis protein MotB